MTTDRARRLRVLLALLAVLVVVLAVVWPRANGTPEPAPHPEGEERAPDPVPAVAAAPPGGAPPAPPPPPDDPIADYLARTRYPPTAGRLSAGAADLLEPNGRYETLRPVEASLDRGPDGVVTHLLDVDRYYYTGDEEVAAILRVRRGGEIHPVVVTRGVAVAESASGPVGEERLVFRLEDGEPTARLDLAEVFPEHHGPIRLVVEFAWEPGAVEEASLRIFTTPAGGIPATFTGRDRDYLDAGSLVVEVGIDVLRAGFYRIDANLFGPAGEPLAYTAWKGELSEGVGSVPLEFFGLLLRDLGAPGPYEVRNLRGYLFREAEYPDRLRMRDATHTHWTHAYALAGFSEEEYTSPHKAHMIELLEADLASGVTVDRPGGVGGAGPPSAADLD